MKISKYYSSNKKKFFDLFLALALLVILSPLLLVLSAFIFVIDGKPVIFKQKRYGQNKKIFILYKFRTMKNGASQLQPKLKSKNEAPFPMFKISSDPRFTILGKYLSNLGIDEIPQLVNIIKNEMSLIGPRPLPLEEADRLNNTWNFRYKVKPGILSEWALSPKRYKSLENWQQLEKNNLKNGSVSKDILLITKSLYVIMIKKTIKKISNSIQKCVSPLFNQTSSTQKK